MKATKLPETTRQTNMTTVPASAARTANDGKVEQADKHLIARLRESDVFRKFAHSFSELTGLPLTLRSRHCWQLSLHGDRHESPFCKALAEAPHGCGACLEMQDTLAQAGEQQLACRECPFKLVDTVVPIKTEGRTIGFLQTGQVTLKPVDPENLRRAAKELARQGIQIDTENLEDAYLKTRYIEPKKYRHMVELLQFMAEHLSQISNELAIRQQNAEPAFITRARKYIEENLAEELPLSQVAKAVNTSSFYFCKSFKKATGLNFTHYVSRVRIERAKKLLHNPNLRVSEIAFDVGFQSLTHFNRMFRNLTGVSPTKFRNQKV